MDKDWIKISFFIWMVFLVSFGGLLLIKFLLWINYILIMPEDEVLWVMLSLVGISSPICLGLYLYKRQNLCIFYTVTAVLMTIAAVFLTSLLMQFIFPHVLDRVQTKSNKSAILVTSGTDGYSFTEIWIKQSPYSIYWTLLTYVTLDDESLRERFTKIRPVLINISDSDVIFVQRDGVKNSNCYLLTDPSRWLIKHPQCDEGGK